MEVVLYSNGLARECNGTTGKISHQHIFGQQKTIMHATQFHPLFSFQEACSCERIVSLGGGPLYRITFVGGSLPREASLVR